MDRFAVAWYPIYRISDGPLRSVFLTYHSLGHCIPSDKKLGQYAGLLQEGLSFPVVGLESYNTQVFIISFFEHLLLFVKDHVSGF